MFVLYVFILIISIVVQVESGDGVQLLMQFQRDTGDEEDVNKPKQSVGDRIVYSSRYPSTIDKKMEGWWVVVGDYANNTLFTIKKVNIADVTKVCELYNNTVCSILLLLYL